MKFVYGKDVPIHMLDNWLKPHEHENILMYCEQAKYTYGEKDDENVAPTGMSAEIRAGELIYRFLFEMTQPPLCQIFVWSECMLISSHLTKYHIIIQMQIKV